MIESLSSLLHQIYDAEGIIRWGGGAGALGENVAPGYRTSAAVRDGWLRSRGHRANILDPKSRSIGVGCAADRSVTLWWTQDFAH